MDLVPIVLGLFFAGFAALMLWLTIKEKKQRLDAFRKFGDLAGVAFSVLGPKLARGKVGERELTLTEESVGPRYPGQDTLFKYKIKMTLPITAGDKKSFNLTLFRSPGESRAGVEEDRVFLNDIEFDQEYVVLCKDSELAQGVINPDTIKHFLRFPGWNFQWHNELAIAISRENIVVYPHNLLTVLTILQEVTRELESSPIISKRISQEVIRSTW
jgi:hypothetical protein